MSISLGAELERDLSLSQRFALVKIMRQSRYTRAVLAKETKATIAERKASLRHLCEIDYAECKIDGGYRYRRTYLLTDTGKIRAGKVVMELFSGFGCKLSLAPRRRGNGIYEAGIKATFNFG